MLPAGTRLGRTAVFSALVLRPAPIKDPSGLIGVWPIDARGEPRSTLAPVADLLQDGPLESVCAYGSSSLGVEANGRRQIRDCTEYPTDVCRPLGLCTEADHFVAAKVRGTRDVLLT